MAMKANRSRLIITGGLLLAGVAAPAYAQKISEARIAELVKQAKAGLAATQAQPAVPAPQATRPTIRLTLEDAVKNALDHNLDIAVQRLNPEISDISYASTKSVYLPSLTSQFA